MDMRAHYLQHVPFEGLGSIDAWLRATGYEVTCTRLFAGEVLPAVDDLDFLVVMGGPMSINDESEHSWLAGEKAFVADVIRAGKPVLGVCLGAQLIASALGARVYPNGDKEIGWFPILRDADVGEEAFAFPESAQAFHWHGETFDLPQGAIRLARSAACRNQAFQVGQSVIGLQFHLETTAESARDIVANCRDELVPAPYVQSEQEILAAEPERFATLNRLMGEVLDFLHRSRA